MRIINEELKITRIVEHKEFIEALRERLDKDAADVESMVNGFCHIVTERCAQMDTVSIQGLGLFESRKKMERISVNPTTGKRMLIPPKIVMVFKPNGVIRNKLKERGES